MFCVQRLTVFLANGRPNFIDVSLNIRLRRSLLTNLSLLLTSVKLLLVQASVGQTGIFFSDSLSEPERLMQDPTELLTETISISNTDPTPADLSLEIKRQINNAT